MTVSTSISVSKSGRLTAEDAAHVEREIAQLLARLSDIGYSGSASFYATLHDQTSVSKSITTSARVSVG